MAGAWRGTTLPQDPTRRCGWRSLRVAAAWGYVDASTTKEIDARLDRVAAILSSLGARR